MALMASESAVLKAKKMDVPGAKIMFIVEAVDFDSVRPKESIQAFDLNCMSLTVGMKRISLMGEFKLKWIAGSSVIAAIIV